MNRSLLPFLAFLPLAACAPTLGAKPEPRSAASLASTTALPNENGQWPGDGWWQRYGDPQLDQLVSEGLAGSPDIAAAAARLARAEGVARQAGASLGPSLTANGSGTFVHQLASNGLPDDLGISGVPHIAGASLNGAFDLDLWGKNRARLRAALRETDAVRVEQAEARIALAAAIADAYVDLSRLYTARDVTEQTLRIQSDTAALVAERVQSGIETEAERRQARAFVPAARADLADIDAQIAATRNRIAALIGAGPDRGLTIARPKLVTAAPTALPAAAGIDLIGRRPDIVAARARVEAAAERIKVARRAYLPDISLSALVGFQAINIPGLISGNLAYAQGGPAVSLPIFDSGRLDGDLRVSRADYDAAVADYDKTLIEALRAVADAVTARDSLGRQIGDVHASLADSEEAYRIARLRYKGGLSTYLDVLTAERAVITARRRDADLAARAFTLDIALVRALGGGFAPAASSQG
jgi:NodT family efflux transporter outer membrane factor (OMF) lipoprotein